MQYSKSAERRAQALELIKKLGKISIHQLSEAIGCSEATARRDLDHLEKSGQIIRTIGGAIYEESLVQTTSEIPFADKRYYRQEEKEHIAEEAAALVKEGDVVCLTGGSTTFLIAKALKNRSNITIVTNAVNIAYELAEAEGVQVVVIGGVMRANSYELIGPLAENVIEKINISKMFLGVDGVSLERGFTTHSEYEARIAQLLIERSNQVYAVFDHTKLKKVALFTIIPLERATGVIMNPSPETWFEEACRAEQLEVYIAP
ncbi:DeoR/GlpR family DNA-binding transcription regulator [Paenibacillus sp. GD4]|uniref:DeoR/GlpR family DNA-binding transcription regulator n=1 Tax=Paenibacillus sp. GD4 TaxID=3068890 RepID=UPI002796A654|nr:DeoR/GlpR family DNA-binding transcription regulator [Paenibacillus sp. GD4]MDQ1912776.1 DeoR/GlpR family DNA-binding transcription regulator [Paenibacillus sp. GD4]